MRRATVCAHRDAGHTRGPPRPLVACLPAVYKTATSSLYSGFGIAHSCGWRAPRRPGRHGLPCRCAAAPAPGVDCTQDAAPTAAPAVDEPDFHYMLGLLLQWKEQYSTCHVPRAVEDPPGLAGQRRKRSQLSADEVAALDAAGFEWKPNVMDAKWYSNYHLARQWWHRHGDITALLPRDADDGGDAPSPTALGVPWVEVSAWLARQQELYVREKIIPSRLRLLRALAGAHAAGLRLRRQSGPQRANLHPLLRGVDPSALPELRRRHTPRLAVGVVTRRGNALLSRALGEAAEEEAALLEELRAMVAAEVAAPAPPPAQAPESAPGGEADEDAAGVAFLRMLAQLQRWRRRFHTCIVPPDVHDKPALAAWLSEACAAQAAGSLAGWQREELEASGMQWRPPPGEVEWHTQLHRLRHFKALHGHCDLARASPGGVAGDETPWRWAGVAAWLDEQHRLHSSQRLGRLRAKLLRKLGVVLQGPLSAASAQAVRSAVATASAAQADGFGTWR